jgi:HTH DNA binding domain./Protein of unknown function (DUF1612).
MTYATPDLSDQTLLKAVSSAEIALVRFDERMARSSLANGVVERLDFADACASLWVDGELVNLEDLVLHDAGHDVRSPTHELVIARDVLRARRRIAQQKPGWALSSDGLSVLRAKRTSPQAMPSGSIEGDFGGSPPGLQDEEEDFLQGQDDLEIDYSEIDALLARSAAALDDIGNAGPRPAREKDPLLYDLDWDEEARMHEWQRVVGEIEHLPPVLQAAVALDAWEEIQVLQNMPWLGRLLASAILHRENVTSGQHLAALNVGLKSIPVDRRRSKDRGVRLLAVVCALQTTGEIGLKEHDRLSLASQMLQRRLIGKRSTSKLPELAELVVKRPLVSATMIAETLKVTPRAALRIIEELGLRELTGRGRFRAWGLI